MIKDITIEEIKRNPSRFQFAKNQTEEMCKIAVSLSSMNFLYVHVQTEEICLEAVKANPNLLPYIKQQTKPIILTAINQGAMSIKYANFIDNDIILAACLQNIDAIDFVDNCSELVALRLLRKHKSKAIAKLPQYESVINLFFEKYFDCKYLKGIQSINSDLLDVAMLKDVNSIKYMREQSVVHALVAVRQNWKLLEFIHNQCNNVIYEAIKQSPEALSLVRNQTEEICEYACRMHRDALRYVRFQTESLILLSVKNNGLALAHAKFQTPDICLAAVSNDGMALSWVNKQTPEIVDAALHNCVEVFQFIKQQTNDLCLYAVSRDGCLLEHVHNQTKEIVLAAIDQNPQAANFIRIGSLATLCEALKSNEFLPHFFDNPEFISDDQILQSVKLNGMRLQNFSRRATPEIELAAVRQNWKAIQYVQNYSEEVCLAAYDQNILALRILAPQFGFESNLSYSDEVSRMQDFLESRPVDFENDIDILNQLISLHTARQLAVALQDQSIISNKMTSKISRRRIDLL